MDIVCISSESDEPDEVLHQAIGVMRPCWVGAWNMANFALNPAISETDFKTPTPMFAGLSRSG